MFRKPWEVWAMFDPDGPGNGGGNNGTVSNVPAGNAGGADFPDLPADPGQDSGGGQSGMRFIDEAFQQMSDDEQNQDVAEQRRQRPNQQQQQEQQPRQPRYPEPVQVGGQRAAQQRPVQGQQPPAQQEQEEPEAPAQLTPEQLQTQQQQLRARSDPFGMQAELLAEQEQSYVQALAQQVYPITQEDMDGFLSGDGSKVSQALARVHVNAVGSVMKVVSQQLPVMLGHYIKMYSASQEREASFYQANTFLDKKVHGPLVADVARTYRRMYPQATDNQVDKAVGIMVAAAAGVQVPAGYTWGGRQQQQQAAQQHHTANGVRTPGKVVRKTTEAFSPAGPNGVGGAPRGADLGPWGELTEIIQADERGAFDR